MQEQTVYIVDDDPGARQSVEALVREMGVAAKSFESAEAFLASYDGSGRGCLVVDVRLGGMSGLELQEELARREWALPLVIITAYAETALTVRAMRNCALTVLEKPCRQLELWGAIRDALRLDRQYVELHQKLAQTEDCLKKLSPGESEVMELVVQGVTNKVIAARLGISTRTVEARRRNIFNKMQVHSVAQLVERIVEARFFQQIDMLACSKLTIAATP